MDYCITSTEIHDSFDSFKVLKNDDMTSDHVPFIIKLNKTQERDSTNRTKYFNSRKVFNFNKANWSKFGELLPNILPTKYGSCVDEINKFVVESIISSAASAIPVYKLENLHEKKLPSYILELIKLRKKNRNFTKRDIDPNIKTRYNKLTEIIREEIDVLKNNEWSEFIQKLGKYPPSTKPFWNRINNIRGKKGSSTMQTLILNDTKYETDEQKANLFLKNLKETFSANIDSNFDSDYKIKVEQKIDSVDFSKHQFHKKDLFDQKELNFEIKKLNKRSSSGENNVHNKMIQNTPQENHFNSHK